MNSTIFIPKKINVGFQNRSDTYTGKLAYVIYYDEKGVLRKEKSWNSWRNNDIPNEEFDNEPMSGFVLNKKVGDYSGHWGEHRQAYCRIYDPRGFEFEITINNLLFILEHCSCYPGKGLDCEFVYGWEGKDLILMPVNSPDYKEITEYSNKINNRKNFKGKDLKIGATYLTKDNETWVYMGRFDYWDCKIAYKRINYWNTYSDWDEDVDKNWIFDNYEEHAYKNINKGKHYWFINLNSENKWYRIQHMKTISTKIIDVINEDCVQEYTKLYNELEKDEGFSPIDYSKDKVCDMDFEMFSKIVDEQIINAEYFRYHKFKSKKNNENFELNYNDPYHSYVSSEYNPVLYIKEYNAINEKSQTITFKNIKEAFNFIQPIIRYKYLENGQLYKIEWK